MEDNADLKMLFKGYYRANDDAVKDIWRDGKIIPDANVLLDLYRYSDDARDAFLNLLNNHNLRVWLPHQAAQEYFQNRPSVINEQSKNYDATLNDINDLYNSFNQKNRHPFLPPNLLGEVEGLFEKLNAHLENSKKSHLQRLNDDEIQSKITEIFGQRVGHPFPSGELNKLFDEGKARYQSKIPPGYEDAQKNDNEKNLVGQQRRYGDLIMWKQIIAYAKEHKTSVILITEDTKDDWWLKSAGRTLSARPELFKEFHDETGQEIQIYRTESFLHNATNYLSENVSEDVIEEIKLIQSEPVFYEAVQRSPSFYDLSEYISTNFKKGDQLPGERIIADAINWNRSGVRENLVRLDTMGYVEIEHGKKTKLIENLPSVSLDMRGKHKKNE
ncbi:PIN domain-containing protein [Alteromonas sp. ASW11-19]|uniref:PIN domain-containing protein n=1 Tax=Alteromonas salexigens TaxID=2982530 RepID=A0ABT2VS05_9ALTE|nr:PIN domain-containing protein [Alteromonas salexigens]MCU7556102.1 PIN domain-containing protein [Alteromonas salexigens]